MGHYWLIMYVFWSCPVLNLFWSEIHSSIEEILEIEIERNNIPDSVNNRNKYLLRILLPAAKKAITCLWLLTRWKDWHSA